MQHNAYCISDQSMRNSKGLLLKSLMEGIKKGTGGGQCSGNQVQLNCSGGTGEKWISMKGHIRCLINNI